MELDQTPVSRRSFLSTAAGAGIGGLAGCLGGSGAATDTPTTSTQETIQAAWVYLSEVGDLGWTHAHDQGRKAVQEDLDFVETSFSEAVPSADAKQVFETYANDGNDIVFGTTFGYMEPMLEVSKNYTDTAWEHCNGVNVGDNMGIYYGKMYHARYLAGIAAGMVTESDKIGFVGSIPFSHTIREINGFAAGVKHVNPDAELLVRWINAFFDPAKAKEATIALIQSGVDVTAQLTDSPATVRAAADNDVWSTGSNSPMREFGGDSYLTSGIWDWGVFYKNAVQSVADENWEPNFDWPGLSTGIVELDDWGPNVPEEVKQEVDSRRQQLVDGDLTVFQDTKFEGKSDDFLYYDMGSYIENIRGSVPES